jgi:hypothetical protein
MNRDDRLQGPRAFCIVLAFFALYGAAAWLALGGL